MKRNLFSLLLFLVISLPVIVTSNAVGEVYYYLLVEPLSLSEIRINVLYNCSGWGCAPIDDPKLPYSCVIYRDGKIIVQDFFQIDQNLSPNTTYCYSAKVTQNSGRQILLGPQCAKTFAYTILASANDYNHLSAGVDITPGDFLLYVYAGSEQTYSIVPFKGYRIRDVLVDGKSVGAVESYTFSNISADHTLVVISQKITSMSFLLQLLLDD